ncbi:MAG: RdgB/HAM1 family non-canonical purine NTP pyrophosphatase [Planctomycetes bacterium]|nr:RdgB/HAM1 family non-canonical purine NTP pyrophosphatase [Planctomycetota bacterium]
MRTRILVATTNRGKIAELRQMLAMESQLVSLDEVGPFPEVVEDGATFAENARKKACEYAKISGLWTVSDDSGLVIDALRGAPGIHSARFCGETSADRSEVDRKNIYKVLELMVDVPPEQRTARFVCALCLADPDQVLIETQGTFEGLITSEPMGGLGFGYDPIFWVSTLKKTVAQLPPEQKNELSHRGQAIRRLKPKLEELLLLRANG